MATKAAPCARTPWPIPPRPHRLTDFRNRMVPVSVELARFEGTAVSSAALTLVPASEVVAVFFGPDLESLGRRGVRDQLDDRPIRDEGSTAPVSWR